ncbi:LuxR family transcriptional regulator [Pseudonocardia sp. MH-G8]|nr:LuxR family transcriptional regulator [Pseudonocardia sp. MH-G8]
MPRRGPTASTTFSTRTGRETRGSGTELFGRGVEIAELDRVLAGASDGAGSGLVLWGEPGIGKTALLEYAVDTAADVTVLRCRGTRMEAGIAFAALHELLWPVMDRLDTLAAPQAAALRGALGLSRDETNRFLVGAAVLSLVCDLARERPVLVAVDDAQWVDEATAHCLGFLARRIGADPVAVLLTGHEDPHSGPWEGLRAREVVGLAEDDARRLVAAAVPAATEDLVERTVRAAGGNPLALHELATIDHELDADPVPGRPGDLMTVGPRLRRAFVARAAAMTAPARALLLLAAAEERGDRHVVHRAGAGWGVDTSTWEELLRSGLVRAAGPRLAFRHPLIPAAVYDGTPFAQRQAAHRALAAALPSDATAERAWHLATAADSADEDVAALLEQAAVQSLRRSGGPTAVRTLRRAAELSPDEGDAARRLAAAARAAWTVGYSAAARQLLDDAEHLVGERHVARLSHGLRGFLEFAHGVPERAHHYLTSDMAVVEDPREAMEMGSMAVRSAWSAGRDDLQQEALERLSAVDTRGDPTPSGLVPLLRSWWSCHDTTDPVVPVDPETVGDLADRLGTRAWGLLPPIPLLQCWGVEGRLHDVLRVQTAALRRRQEITALAALLVQTAVLDVTAGRWDAAGNAVVEALGLAEEVGTENVATQCRLVLASLAAPRGDEHTVDDLTTRVLAASVPRGVRALSANAYWHRGRAALFGGRPQEALDHLVCLSEPGHDAAHHTCALLAAADTVEAAVQVGRLDVVEPQITMIDGWVRRTGATWARTAAHRIRALVRSGPDAEESYRAALEVPGAPDDPFEHARTRLLYGEWLRRARRRAEAGRHLTGAAQVFERLGAEPLRARALRELALSEGSRARGASGPANAAGLTAQELRVAQLAAGRLTNRDIAAQLLISHRTVGHHLGNVYPKLGITSRAELARIDFAGDLRISGGS